MIITLIGANFAGEGKNIGTLSTWNISRVLGSGATYAGPNFVNKDAALSATVTIATGYELGSAGVTVTMGGSAVTSGVSTSGNVITISISKVTGNVVIKVPTVNTSTGEEDGGGTDGNGNKYNSADMWVRQSISIGGAVSTTDITYSNIMPKENFVGTATITVTGDSMMIALVTYKDDGSFKARGSWDIISKGNSVTYTDANPFSVVICTQASNTSYTVAEMIAMLNIVGTSESDSFTGTIYSDSYSYWTRQNMSSSGQIILPDNTEYGASNIMAVSNFTEAIKITSKKIALYTAMITYDNAGQFKARSSWTTLAANQNVTYTDSNPFNIIIATTSASSYSLEEMLEMVDVRSA